ncbi:hypothetical protein [Fibrobacter sp. UWB12]|uniref:hypothetical protein n=1 Tax=Fibrobacter sp. UWB12 TaxID=1896203 RepID=UPI00091A265A|nr:hypothetical protein [Fibrobacter sp. UWB12]SHK78306.1 hypothetical protein SAMN05720759_106199 [Fibrobacter sp. UWB12]
MADINIKKVVETKNLKQADLKTRIDPGISGGERGIKPRIPETPIELPKTFPNGGEPPLKGVVKDKNIGRR